MSESLALLDDTRQDLIERIKFCENMRSMLSGKSMKYNSKIASYEERLVDVEKSMEILGAVKSSSHN